MNFDEKYMRRAIELASLGNGFVAPNPMVGAVVVHDHVIVGEGYHRKFGEAHAEVNAIASVLNQEILPECTIYVSLEPCAHFGKTPPCSDLIVEKKLKRVVIGCGDSFRQVDGKGIERIRAAGIEVTAFVLQKEARAINKKFFMVQEKQRPYVLLKWAETRNGRIDNTEGEQDSVTWISGPETQPFVHQLRSENTAILVGKNTVLKDNPSLTVRKVEGKQPLRVILDSNCSLTKDRTVFTDGQKTLVLNTLKNETSGAIEFCKIDAMTPESILAALHQKQIQSVLIEGGARVLQSFLDAQLWDEAIQIVGPNTFASGTKAPRIAGTLVEEKQLFDDLIKRYHP